MGLDRPFLQPGHRSIHLEADRHPPSGRRLSGGPAGVGHLLVGWAPRLEVPASTELVQPSLVAGAATVSTGASSTDTAGSSLAAEVDAGLGAAGELLLRCLGCLAVASWLHGLVSRRSGLA